jgi:hypothetical protein
MDENADLRCALERSRLTLGSSSIVAPYLSQVLQEELSRLKEELLPTPSRATGPRRVSIFIDGSTSGPREVYSLVCRYVTPSFFLQQRVLGVAFQEEHLPVLIDQFFHTYKFSPTQVVAVTVGCGVSATGLEAIQAACHLSEMVVCLRGVLQTAYTRFHTPSVGRFLPLWARLMSRSSAARRLFQDTARRPPLLPAAGAGWVAEWDVAKQLLAFLPELRGFLERCAALEGGFVAADSSRCLELVTADGPAFALQVAAMVDAGAPLVAAHAKMDADGMGAVDTYDVMCELQQHVAQPHLPNTVQLAELLAHSDASLSPDTRDAAKTAFITDARAAVTPAFSYLHEQFQERLRHQQGVFEACTVCNPRRVNDIASEVVPQLLNRFPDLSEEDRKALCDELPLYKTRAQEGEIQDVISWWRGVRNTLPQWSALAATVALLQPSTAAVEAVVALVEGCPEVDASAAMTAVMSRYNDGQRRKLDVPS